MAALTRSSAGECAFWHCEPSLQGSSPLMEEHRRVRNPGVSLACASSRASGFQQSWDGPAIQQQTAESAALSCELGLPP